MFTILHKDIIIRIHPMNEIQFLHKNMKKWEAFESLLDKKSKTTPDKVSEMFIHLTDDLAYSRTYFPDSKATAYLNQLTQKAHRIIYQNKRGNTKRIRNFWVYEFPLLVYESRKEVLASFSIFFLAILTGILSNKYDIGFVRIIMGDSYVNMSLANIENGDPLAVYKSMKQIDMFLGITLNNIWVSFTAFVMGLLTPVGTGYILMKNGVMLGTFQSFLAQKGFLLESIATIWVHGTFEIYSIIVAGAAGIIVGKSFMFPGSFSRIESFKQGARKGSKIVIGLIPFFMIAGFLEGFITRYTQAPYAIRIMIIFISLTTIVTYFYIYPIYLIKNKTYDKQFD